MIPKLRHLHAIIAKLDGAIVAFSGGADSALLAEVADTALPSRALIVTADSPSLPRQELEAAIRLASDRGWQHQVIQTRELDDERYSSNPSNRCYYCKAELMGQLAPIALRSGYPILLGTNVDDLSDFRPGQKAASEGGALHPMVEARLTKQEIRAESRRLGLPTWDKPAAACLASRFRHGVRVTAYGLARVEAAERSVIEKGYRVVRVRDLGQDHAVVEVGSDEVGRLFEERSEIEVVVSDAGFRIVDLDPDGYRMGSMGALAVLPLIVDVAPLDGDVTQG